MDLRDLPLGLTAVGLPVLTVCSWMIYETFRASGKTAVRHGVQG